MISENRNIQLVNAVGGGDLNVEIRLEQVASDIEANTVEYEPETSPMLRIKFSEANSTIMLFRTGSYFIAGASSIEDLEENFERLVEELNNLIEGISKEKADFEVRNLVFNWSTGKEFELSTLCIGLDVEKTEYEPEQFPGIIYKNPNADVTYIIFRTGSIMLMGASNYEEANESYQILKKSFSELGIDLSN